MAAAYHNVCELVGQWGVSWADDDREGDPTPFHINSIIDIPLVTSAGVVLNRVASPGHPTVGTAARSGTPHRTNMKAWCPDPVQNGQAAFSTHPAPVLGSLPGAPPSAAHSGQPASSHILSGASSMASNAPSLFTGRHPTSSAPTGKQDTSCSNDQNSRTSSTIHAGHTPNPKKLPHRTDSSQGQTVEYPAAVSPSACLSQHGNNPTTPSSRLSPSAPPLNDTFSVIDKETHSHSLDTTVVTEGCSHLCLPVINSEQFHGAEKSGVHRKNIGAVHGDGPDSSVLSNSQQVPVASGHVSSTHQFHAGETGNVGNTGNVLMSSSTPMTGDKQQAKFQNSTGSHHNNENEGQRQKPHSNARRAITFDGATTASTPVRVEGKSYADAVRTPTPPRQPLRTLDCNSPQFQTNSLPAGEQTPKGSGRSSLYIACPEALDNMRRLKQLGMPSLVENLVTGVKADKGGHEVSKPGYMQPTKATARRVRLQTSRDDSFNPKRVPRKNLAHSRSKSTSQLNKTGWKI